MIFVRPNFIISIKLTLKHLPAGQDATEAFYGLHRHEVLTKPAYQRLVVGKIEGEEPVIKLSEVGEISRVPYAEPTWLNAGFHSPYYKEVRISLCSYVNNAHCEQCSHTASSRKPCVNSQMSTSTPMLRYVLVFGDEVGETIAHDNFVGS